MYQWYNVGICGLVLIDIWNNTLNQLTHNQLSLNTQSILFQNSVSTSVDTGSPLNGHLIYNYRLVTAGTNWQWEINLQNDGWITYKNPVNTAPYQSHTFIFILSGAYPLKAYNLWINFLNWCYQLCIYNPVRRNLNIHPKKSH